MPFLSSVVKKNNRLIMMLVGGLALYICLAVTTYAQRLSSPSFLHSNTIFSNDVVTVQTYFYSEQDVEETTAVVDGERISLTQQNVEKLNDEPFHLIILYDASGSVRPTAAEMRTQAEQLLNQLPSNAQIAIYRFSDNVVLEEPFSSKGSAREQLMSAIDELQPTSSATCFYDALSHVVTAASQVSPNTPRRAVLVLSDGRDENTQGQSDRCSRNNEADIINQATNLTPPLPIYTLGFQGSEPADEETLAIIAEETNGRFAMAEGQTLFRHLTGYFANQWLLQVELLPAPGEHAGDIVVSATNGESFTQSFSFVADRDYRPVEVAPEPLRVEIRNFDYLPDINHYEVEYFFSNPTLAQNFSWQIQVTNIVTPSLQMVRSIPITTTQPQKLLFLNRVDNEPQPSTPYSVEIEPVTIIPEGVDVQFGEPYEWVSPPLPRLEIDTELSGFSTQELMITYTLNSPQFVSSIEGYVWEINTDSTPYTFSLPIASTPLTTVTESIAVSLGNNFGVYSITTYLKRNDVQYLDVPPLQRAVDNTLWNRFISWLVTSSNSLQLLGFLLIPILIILLGVNFVVRSLRNRPLPDPPPPPPPTISTHASNEIAVRVVASPDKSYIGQPIPIDSDLFFIGREGCNLNLENDRQISRRHVALERKEDGLYITDLNSRNGTFLDGKRLNPNQRQRLDGNLEIKLGNNTRLRFS